MNLLISYVLRVNFLFWQQTRLTNENIRLEKGLKLITVFYL